MAAEEDRALALSFFELVGRGELDAAMALFAEDARYWNPGTGESDLEGLRRLLEGAAALFDGPMTMQIAGAFGEGGRVAVEAKSSVKLKRGGRYANSYCFVFEIEGGRIARLREYCDTAPAAVFAQG